jgi:hypothetical protein
MWFGTSQYTFGRSNEMFLKRRRLKAGGIAALKKGGNPMELMRETKVRIFAA